MKAGITLAMIVKDDAERLRRCLQSVRRAVDEIVVLDTGSKDGSPGVAAEFGARVQEIAWPGAFDAALNHALDKVETEWTLRLDSDEWFEDDVAERIRALTTDDQALGYYFVRRDLYDDRPPAEMQLLRLWRTHPRLRYEGIVHEVIPLEAFAEVANGRKLAAAPLLLMHDGYTGGSLPNKRQRNIALLRQLLDQKPNDLHYRASLAEALVADHDPVGTVMAQEITDEVLKSPEKRAAPPLIPWVMGVALEAVPESELFSRRTQSIIRYLLRWHFNNVVALWGVATSELRRRNLMQSYHALRELEEMGETGDYDRLAPAPLVFVTVGAWEYLGNVALKLGKRDVAKRNFQRLLKAHPEHQGAAAALKELG